MKAFLDRTTAPFLALAVASALVFVLAAAAPAPAMAQDFEDAEDDTTGAAADSLSNAEMLRLAALEAEAVSGDPLGPFWQGMTNKPKAGVRSNVRQYSYYGENVTNVNFREGSFNNTSSYSWEEYRKQDKTLEKRTDQFSYNAGRLFPFVTSITGNWDWSEDLTTNTAGFTNLSKRDSKNINLSASKTKFQTGAFTNTLKADARVDDQKSVNQGQRNDFSEGSLSGGLQSGTALSEGVTVAGRYFAKTTSGDRSLGNSTSPSSASADSAGFGVYFDRSFGTGRVAVTRSNFDKKYLDFKKNSNGLIDTVGLDDQDKVVEELETRDAVSVEFEHTLQLRRMKLITKASRSTDNQDYRVSGVGLKEREQDQFDVTWGFGVGRDSLALSYKFLWKWDDQRIKGATLNRGRQYTKSRNYDLTWMRPLIGGTRMTFKYHEGLTQDIAEKVHNQNDKDRLQTDVSLRLDRDWQQKFKTSMIFSYKQGQDLSIRESRSSNNNVKDSYEISPGFLWTLAPWLTLDQSYQVFIQYTDYVYSDLESVNRDDNYNKRGNLTTKVTIKPTRRLDLVVRNDYNRRFNATRVVTDAAGNSYYHKDQIQTISKIDFGMTFRVAPGVTLESATYQTEDVKDTFGARDRTTTTRSGEVWVGTKVNKRWGKTRPLELSATVKKYNAYGPAVTATSADYWEADVWMKWEF
ncbi:MAG: hypothetical protein ABIK96_17005 [bacterium]